MIKKRKFNITTSEIIHSKIHIRAVANRYNRVYTLCSKTRNKNTH